MASGIKVTKKGRPLAKIPIAPPAVMREIGEGILGRIRTRTSRGVDVNGRAFRSLSKLYAKVKREAIGHSRADLTVSGRMLQDMVIRPRPGMFEIRFKSAGGRASGRTLIQRSRSVGAADKAFWHNISGAGRAGIIREFFSLNEEDVTFIVTQLDKHLGQEVRR